MHKLRRMVKKVHAAKSNANVLIITLCLTNHHSEAQIEPYIFIFLPQRLGERVCKA